MTNERGPAGASDAPTGPTTQLTTDRVRVDGRGWAREYAEAGALVLALHTPASAGCSCRKRDCEHPGKHPRTMHGKDDATSHLDTVDRWWKMWPESNVGIRPAEGIAVLDIDPRNGGDVQLAAMQALYGALPDTLTARTGSGGEHWWFLCPGPVRGKLAEGIDVKTHSGYLVAPPSIHACGQRYRWTSRAPIAPAPEYLRNLLAPPTPPSWATASRAASPKAAAGLLRVVAEAQEGARNARLYWACCRAFEHGIDINPLVEAAVANGLTRKAAEATAVSASRAPGRVGAL